MTDSSSDKAVISKIKGPWTQLDCTEVYRNPWIRITHENVTTPAGTPGIYGVVNFYNEAIGIVPLDAEGYTYLVKQYRYTLEEYSWEIPMGGSPRGENPQLTAERELAEETGLRASEWTRLMTLHPSNSITNEVGHVFLAEGLQQGEAQLEETEDIVVQRLPLTEAVEMVLDGHITDAISVAALLRVERMRR